uniref:Uncharacterized protein n=1 Tax=Anguilla anguilla TaxID=7936 RepID=A0A0E9VKI0_ANGAN
MEGERNCEPHAVMERGRTLLPLLHHNPEMFRNLTSIVMSSNRDTVRVVLLL